ncbi:hypothetical protein [Pseudoclavibacter helvolus]|uniref:HK97 gp10 family phage protein n=1 Tax=Pseudoclavibacter helvolus TaxID=255205 RepID=A0A7W4UMK5_9MICO|nr:hypothetical protein [Pseudoclavibacter helvolus]MBB2956789.1 hypothetical protein [Pseudoclavibacter helvolus]
MTSTFDNSQVQRLAASFENFDAVSRVNLKKAGTVTARRVKDESKALAQSDFTSGSASAYPHAIGYETIDRVNDIAWEIGPDKERRQGPLGNLFEYGSRNNPPFAHLETALEANEDDFVRGIEIAAAQTLEDLLR